MKKLLISTVLLVGIMAGAFAQKTNHEYVDLGLPSGTLWATCNIGADTPESYGDYFAWGETQPKSDSYKFYPYKSALNKYCSNPNFGLNDFSDDLTVLQECDDAATINWGPDWCMPTQEQWVELMRNTTVTWTTQNGVTGRLFTAKNGSSLFLPAAGIQTDKKAKDDGDFGHYWSSTLYLELPQFAWSLRFNSNKHEMFRSLYRNFGLSVRAVRSRHD